MPPTTRFDRIELHGWQHLDLVDVKFHPRLTVLTGSNGSGKSSLLRFLARHFGWEYPLLRTPGRTRRGVAGPTFTVRVRRSAKVTDATAWAQIGQMRYSTGRTSAIRLEAEGRSASYLPTIDNPESMSGFYIPSHRPEFTYTTIDRIPLRPPRSRQAFDAVHQQLKDASMSGSSRLPLYGMKETLIGLAVFGSGNEVVEKDPDAEKLFRGFEAILRTALPREIGFRRIVVRASSEVVLITDSGDFLLDAVSGGVSSLVTLAWEIFMFSEDQGGDFTVVVDEPENHLHPSLQRTILPSLLDAFPQATFVVATHSPLVVGSVRDSSVYALRFNRERRVRSESLDIQDRAGSASEILQEILDVPSTVPPWVEAELARVVAEYSDKEITNELLSSLRRALRATGLERWAPEVISDVVGTGGQH